MNHLARTAFIIFLISISTGYTQNKLNFDQFGDETIEFIRQPIKWNASDYGKLGLVALSTYLVMYLDEDIRSEMLMDRSYYYSLPIEGARIWGEPYTTLLFSGALAISGIANDNFTNKKIAFEIAQSAVYTVSVTQFLKLAVGRERPYLNSGATNFSPFQKVDNDYWSLPSGHTSLAFSLSTILSKNSKPDLLKAVWFIPAIMTAFSRVYQDKHWTSDVLLGAAVGYFIAEWVHKQHDAKETNMESNQLIMFSIAF
ncbi:MAG: phosphatase PAP2 family protein [Bacteroidota bacterium]